MERLTKRDGGGNARMNCDDCDLDSSGRCGILQCRNQFIHRLAAYEDTGLEPAEIEIANKVIVSAFNLAANSGTDMLIERLREIIRAEAEGCLVVLPCKVGDIVWAFWDVPTSSRYVIYCAEVKEFRLREKHFGSDISVLLEPVDFIGRRKEYGEDDFGNTVFRTREEAEAKLKTLQNT